MNKNNKTFMKVTNAQIYNEIQEMRIKMAKLNALMSINIVILVPMAVLLIQHLTH